MSWLFSRALVEEFSAGICSDGELSAPLSVMPTQHKFWRNDKPMEHSRLSQFGLTCAVLTESRGEELLTSYRAAFPVRTYQQPAREKESTERGRGSGRNLQGSFARYLPDLRLWRIPQGSLLEDYIEFSETWPKWGLMRGGVAYRQKTPSGLTALRRLITSARESGLSLQMPTPNCVDFRSDGELRILARANLPIEEFNAMSHRACQSKRDKAMRAPTPTVCGNYNRKGAGPKSGDGLATFVKRLPTPTVQDSANNGPPSQMERNSLPLNAVVGGALNPDWVEWLMGWPVGWTDLRPLATDKFRQWQRSHGVC